MKPAWLFLLIVNQLCGNAYASEPTYSVPPGTRGNTIELEITNSLPERIQSLSVSIVRKPAWLTITSTRVDSVGISAGAACTALTSFNVANDAKTGDKGEIVIAIQSRGVTVAEKTISLTVPLPEAYDLFPNYPNPFNPETTIRYQIPSDVYVTLIVYDILGRAVTTLINEVQKADYYTVRFDARRFASGTYFYRLQAGSYVQTRKMLILR